MRLIDTDKLEVDMEETVFCGDGSYKVFGYSTARGKSAPTIYPPPNPPLTLEELREMDGELVWVERRGSDSPLDREWALVNRENCLCKTASGCVAFFELYGKTWLAYRRKPEEMVM